MSNLGDWIWSKIREETSRIEYLMGSAATASFLRGDKFIIIGTLSEISVVRVELVNTDIITEGVAHP
jgi:hypothetical protein